MRSTRNGQGWVLGWPRPSALRILAPGGKADCPRSRGTFPQISGGKESTLHPALLPALSTHTCEHPHVYAHTYTYKHTHMQMTGAALPSPGQQAGHTAGRTVPVAGGQAQSRSTIWQNLENSLLHIPQATIAQGPGHRGGCKAQEAAEHLAEARATSKEKQV